MYHINPACTKRILASMPKSEIPTEMEKIKQKVIETPPGNERNKFIRLYQWCEKLNPPR